MTTGILLILLTIFAKAMGPLNWINMGTIAATWWACELIYQGFFA